MELQLGSFDTKHKKRVLILNTRFLFFKVSHLYKSSKYTSMRISNRSVKALPNGAARNVRSRH